MHSLRILCILALLPICVTAQAQQVSFDATIVANGATSDALVALPINTADAREMLGWQLADDGWGARVVDAESGEEVVSQTHFTQDGRAQLTWLVPGEHGDGTEREYRVTLGVDPSPAGEDRLSVERTEDLLLVRTPWFVARHDLTAGGLLGTVEFAEAGTLPMRTNDRLWDREEGNLNLTNDRAPVVEVVGAGPLQVVIRTTARYCRPDGTPAPGDPRATYEFAYNAFSPTVQMRATVRQRGGPAWSQLHVFEMYHRTQEPFFDTVAWSPPLESVEFVDEHNTHSLRGKTWGALLTDEVALGLIGVNLYGIHTGLSGHGVYVHGPWHTFGGGEVSYDATLYLGPSGGSAEALAERMERLSSRWETTVRVPELEEPIAAVREAIDAASPEIDERLEGDARERARWMLDVADWLAADAGRSATSLAALRDWRAALNAAQGAVEAVTAQWTAAEPPEITSLVRFDDESCVLAGGGTVLRLARDDAGVRIAQIGRSGEEPALFLAPDAERGDLWALTFRRGRLGEEETVRPTDARDTRWEVDANAAEGALRLHWPGCALGEQANAIDVTVTVRMEPGCDLSRWSLAWENRAEEFGIWQIDFPRVGGVGPGGQVVVPMKWGQLYDVPLPGAGYRGRYPSQGAFAQMMCWWREGSGLYYAAHDPDAGVKQPAALNDGPGTIAFDLATSPGGMGVPAGRGELGYEVAIGSFDGDWFDAGKVYREWATQQFWTRKGPIVTREDMPQWWKDCALSIRPTGDPDWVTEMGTALQAEFDMEAVLHWYVWHQIPFDDDYPEYFPVKPGFGEAVAALQSVGVHVMPYVNGHLWDTDTDSWIEENAIVGAALTPKGELYIERWRDQEHAVMCPGSEKWKSKMIEIALRLADEYGCDAIYLDQIGATSPRLCFNDEHDHPVGGGAFWARERDDLLAEMRRQCQAANPRFVMTTESQAEPYMAVLDGHLMCNLVGANQVPLYVAIYGGYTQTFGRLGEVRNPTAFRMQHGQAFAFGSMMGRINSLALLEPENAELLGYLKALAEIRRDYREFMAFGEMLRPPRIVGEVPWVTTQWQEKTNDIVTLPAIQAAAWRAPDGRLGLFYTNVAEEPVSFTHSFALADYGVTATDVDADVHSFNAPEGGAPELASVAAGQLRLSHTMRPMETIAVILTDR